MKANDTVNYQIKDFNEDIIFFTRWRKDLKK
jgi:hypothetical protein